MYVFTQVGLELEHRQLFSRLRCSLHFPSSLTGIGYIQVHNYN